MKIYTTDKEMTIIFYNNSNMDYYENTIDYFKNPNSLSSKMLDCMDVNQQSGKFTKDTKHLYEVVSVN